jgi:hypothetical protein
MATITISLKNVRGEVFHGFDVRHDLPALTGSDKQVAWATAIRDAAIADFVQARLIDRTSYSSHGQTAWLKNETWVEIAQPHVEAINTSPVMAKLAAALEPITSAKAWIEAEGGSKSLLTIQALLTRKG